MIFPPNEYPAAAYRAVADRLEEFAKGQAEDEAAIFRDLAAALRIEADDEARQ